MIAFTKKTPAGKGRSFTRYKVSSVASVSQIGLEHKGAEIWKRIDVIFMPDIQVPQFNAIRNIRIVFVLNLTFHEAFLSYFSHFMREF